MLCHDKTAIKNKWIEQNLTGLTFPPIVCGVNQSRHDILRNFSFIYMCLGWPCLLTRGFTPPLVNAFGMLSCKYIKDFKGRSFFIPASMQREHARTRLRIWNEITRDQSHHGWVTMRLPLWCVKMYSKPLLQLWYIHRNTANPSLKLFLDFKSPCCSMEATPAVIFCWCKWQH